MPEPIYKQQSKITQTAPIQQQLLLKADKEMEAALVRVASDPKQNKPVRVAAQTKLAQRNADKTKRRVIQRTNKRLSPLVENLIEQKAVKSATDLDPDVRNAKAVTQNNGIIVDANAITRAKTLDNINNGGFFWNIGNGFNYTPNYLTQEGRDAIEQQNTTNALNTAVGLSMGFSGPVLQSYGFPALLASILGGYAGNELGTKAVSLFTDDPRWQAAGGLAGMLIGSGAGFKLRSTSMFLTPEQQLALQFQKATGVNYWNPAPGQVSRYINRQIVPTYNYPIVPIVNGTALEPKGQIELTGLKAQSPKTLAISPWAKVRANPSKQLKPADFVPEQTRFLYTGPKHSIREVVNSDGTVNIQKALQIANAEANRQGGWRMSQRLENPEWHKTDPNTFLHTKEVAQRAWQMPTPTGYTKQDQMFAALGHDFGKMFAGEGHGEIGADYLKQMFPDMTDAQYNAIAKHMMSEDVARMQFSDQPLTLATMEADRGGIPLFRDLWNNHLTDAERLGIPKGERGNLTYKQRDALSDLYQYIHSSRHRRIPFYIDDKIVWENINTEAPTLLKELADLHVPMKGSWFRFKTSTNGLNGVISYDPYKQVLSYSSQAKPSVKGLSYKPGEASTRPDGVQGSSLVLTSPRVDVQDYIEDLLSDSDPAEKALGQRLAAELSRTLSKETMGDFWKGVAMTQKPGTYLSGDNGSLPLGANLIQNFNANRLTGIYPYLKLETKPRVFRMGLSPDSYSSIIRQNTRGGTDLRWGEGFVNWNDSAIANKHIYDAWTNWKSGKITIEEYKKIFDEWANQIGGKPLEIITVDGKQYPVHPHPYLYRRQKGGKLVKDYIQKK